MLDTTLQEIKQEKHHLCRFAKDVGLGYQVGGRIYMNDLWERLRQWYIDNDTLVVTAHGKQKWQDPPHRGGNEME